MRATRARQALGEVSLAVSIPEFEIVYSLVSTGRLPPCVVDDLSSREEREAWRRKMVRAIERLAVDFSEFVARNNCDPLRMP